MEELAGFTHGTGTVLRVHVHKQYKKYMQDTW